MAADLPHLAAQIAAYETLMGRSIEVAEALAMFWKRLESSGMNLAVAQVLTTQHHTLLWWAITQAAAEGT